MTNLLMYRHVQELRDLWQGKALAAAQGKLAAVMLSVLAHNYDEAMPILLRVIFPGFTSIRPPFYCNAARIAHNGAVVAHMIDRKGHLVRNSVIFKDEAEMQSELRALADQMTISDAERVEMFAAVRRWIVADFRQDPNNAEAA